MAATELGAAAPSASASKRRLNAAASFRASMRQMSMSPTPMTRGMFISTFISVTLGTFLEFLDFSLFASLDYILKPIFNISGTVYWAIFALGFVSRPVGAVIFGWVGDTFGRRTVLLITIIGVAGPTLLIGCLPTYKHIGAAAPALLATLRTLQGLAVGGEYGSALVYIQEVAPPRWQATMVDAMSASSKFATIVGILIVVIIQATCTIEQMDQWAWRVPFLIAAVLGGTALVMRRFMPESHEFTERRALLAEEDAALHLEDGGHKGAKGSHHDDDDDDAKHFPGSEPAAHHANGNGGADSVKLRASKSLQRVVSSGVVRPVRALSRTVTQAAHKVNEAADRHQAPFFDLVKHHWEGLALQFLALIYLQVHYYALTSKMPALLRAAGVSPNTSLGMTIMSLVLLLSIAVACGYVVDRFKASVTLLYAIGTVLTIGIQFGASYLFHTMDIGGIWAMFVLHGFVAGLMNGSYPVIGNQIYPAEVRVSGMNIGHNLSAVLGGLTPTFIGLIKDTAATEGVATYSVAIWFCITGGVSLIACALITWRHKWACYTNLAGRERGILAPWTVKQDAHDLLARGNGPHAPHVPETVAE